MPERKPDPLRHCSHCGAPLGRKRFNGRLEDMGAFMRRAYCDRDCMASAFTGQPRALEPAARTLRDRARKVKGLGPCEGCGGGGEVDVHHRDGNIENNALDNLERLCRPCHLSRHRGEGGRWGAPPLDVAAEDVGPAEGQVSAMAIRGREGGAQVELSDVAPALRASQGGSSRAMVFRENQRSEVMGAEVAPTLAGPAGKGSPMVLDMYNQTGVMEGGVTPTLSTSPNAAVVPDVVGALHHLANMDVDGAAADPETGALYAEGQASAFDPRPDGRRWAACGDGVVAPVATWIGLRLREAMRGSADA